MYGFIDTNAVSEGNILPSEALKINGEYIENQIKGYRTLQVRGRESLSAELDLFTTAGRDGSTVKNKRYPERIITVVYQLIAESNEAFREAYNQLGGILNVSDAELIFEDEQDKYFVGTPCTMGEIPPGRNTVIGEFEIICADPFKYSVIEYEAEPSVDDNSILIDYHGTYKGYPTLEAEFHNENENNSDVLTGNGDCGYVAFFNDKEKIIQLGDPDETDTESYAKSQTLIHQMFNTEAAWGALAQKNWASNDGKLLADNLLQLGNVNIAVADHLVTVAPSTSGTLLTKKAAEAKPNIDYKVTAKTTNRTENSVDVNVTVSATPAVSGSTGGGGLSIKAGAKISLNNTNIYVSSDTSSSAGKRTGTYYLWDASVKNKRIRITNSSSNVGKSGQVSGWVNVSDIGAATTAAVSIAKEVGLKCGIKLGSSDWAYAKIKPEGTAWTGNKSHTASITVKVKSLDDDTTAIEDIKFKVERTDENEDNNKVGILEETLCNDLEISTYTAPVPNAWYLKPESYGVSGVAYTGWHGASITRTLPADAAGDVGAKSFTLSFNNKMCIGTGSTATQEYGAFMALLISGSGSSRKVVAGVNIHKYKVGKTAAIAFWVNGKSRKTVEVDISPNNKYFCKNIASTITKTNGTFTFNIGGVKYSFVDNTLKDTAVTQVTFYMPQYGTKPVLTHNGLFWAKFVKHNCDTWNDIPNKFSSNDVVTAICKSGEVLLNNSPNPSLGALGNDWEDFYLTPGLNQIGFSYSDWVDDDFKPKFKVKYREVFI